MFRTADGRNFAVPFVLITSLFLLWGFCNGMIDILNKHFQDTLRINKEQSGLVQAANYLAYFLMAIPAGLIAKRFGYKGGILVGLTLIAGGAFWFIPAVHIGTYWAFLLGLFVIAAGMTCLETIANPYATVLGPPESGPTRINIAQTTNGLGWILGPIVGGYFVFSGTDGAGANAGLTTPYVGIGVFVVLLLVIFAVSNVPDLHAEDESRRAASGNNRLNPTGGQQAGIAIVLAAVCGLLYFFIAPILQTGVDPPTHEPGIVPAGEIRAACRRLCGRFLSWSPGIGTCSGVNTSLSAWPRSFSMWRRKPESSASSSTMFWRMIRG